MAACPHCQLGLSPQEYEGVTVLFCQQCWGHWLDHASLAKILETRDYGFSREEREIVTSSWVLADVGGDDADSREVSAGGIPCPVCRQRMEEAPFADDCPVLVDRCPDHGTWLDAGEIKQLQVFVEQRPPQ